MKYIRRSEDRGIANFGWLQSKHTFSFGRYYDPKHMGVSVLRVINDDMVMPGKGFEQHSHRDMEIISYVIEGALKHEDSSGNNYIVPAGEVQRMSAGRGVMHSEFNASLTNKVKFLQIWIEPNIKGIKPSYQQKKLPQQDALTKLVTPKGENGTLSINQDATISRLVLAADETFYLKTEARIGYLHLIKGKIIANDQVFEDGDAFSIDPEQEIEIKSNTSVEALWFDLPE
ncbi:pirin family protein [Psychromonas sp. 14N.309.X.WAT.B.A12]|uniref:pirin family protein n=1 Tax=unclassified Psychromonas TaxID=2614957 RepID=UPI0025AF89C5|nr:pirin family protein [Psychromonas sp. 14N.309.X.WAT.B.A12]MDN2662273.1 pirin family protein [Psychromonas sp. 14N.309.X.WAT.B.A12]